MNRTVGAIALLGLAFAMPAQDAQAQDPLGGALLGGAAGAILGGVAGGGRGAAIGAVIGGATGAMIGSQGQARGNGYYYYENSCYLQRRDGSYVAAHPRYCEAPPPPAVVYAPPPPPPPGYYGAPARVVYDMPPPGVADPVAWCMQRYRSYDPQSGTFKGYDGIRRPCP
jgi:hypothetical protein